MSLIDRAIGFHGEALALRAQRSEVLAGNLANADTPGYAARDIDFAATLAARMDGTRAADGRAMARTHPGHQSTIAAGPTGSGGAVEILYRQPLQPTADGNTVEAHVEKAAFMENAAGYEASLRFLESRVSGLMNALRGDQR